MARVAIIIPSYNHAQFLSEAIESVLDQTYTDWTLTIIDDGSSDNSMDLATRYATSDPRIHVYQNSANLGTYGTQQRGLDATDSEYVAILNSDDKWHSQKLHHQVEKLESQPEAVAHIVMGEQINQHSEIIVTDDFINWEGFELCELLPILLPENNFLASGVLWQRNELKFDTSCRYSGDHVALLNASLRGPISISNERLTFWRQHESNSYKRSPNQLVEEIRLRKSIRQFDGWYHVRTIEDALIDRGRAMNLLHLSALYTLCGKYHDAKGILGEASQLMPYHPSVRKRKLLLSLSGSLLRKTLFPNEPFPERSVLEQIESIKLIEFDA